LRLPGVSVLFSEPKIPQCSRSNGDRLLHTVFQCSSASRKFLNFTVVLADACDTRFQCSSASRKFLNSDCNRCALSSSACFSALQRAENSSICSIPRISAVVKSFSALQRAENSSIDRHAARALLRRAFQCSSASRKFLNFRRQKTTRCDCWVSVLFSEPKIPQSFYFPS